jgi:hypothetical protein
MMSLLLLAIVAGAVLLVVVGLVVAVYAVNARSRNDK